MGPSGRAIGSYLDDFCGVCVYELGCCYVEHDCPVFPRLTEIPISCCNSLEIAQGQL